MTKTMDKNRADSLSAYIDGLNDGTASSVAESVAELYGGESIRDLVGVVTPFQKDSLFEPTPATKRAAEFQKMRATLTKENATAVVAQPSDSMPVTQRTDILILMLQSMGESWGALWGNLKLIKLPFLLAQEGQCGSAVPNFYFPSVEAAAYNFGAFDKDVLSDIDQLVAMRIVEKRSPPPKRQSQSGDLGIPEKQVDWIYELTPLGKKIAQMLIRGADPVVLERIQTVIREHGNKTADELCSYTYKKYPKSAANSKIRDKYLPKEDGSSPDRGGQTDA